ncbi:hypothetical protein WSM22_20270 [Cytophagales bacterium WSM2-2]|nr:hypothetical protein WSM22_20270 [Cytophagales bacterium WSM2-2]
MSDYEILKTGSRIPGLSLAITHNGPAVPSNDYPVLFIHGATFPSALAFAFRMNGYSWMDNLSENGFDTYALDFLGYGHSDRYPEMSSSSPKGKPVGMAGEIYRDIDKAVDFILQKTGKKKICLIAHSWGGAVAALYATKFPAKVEKLVLFASITKRDGKELSPVIEKTYESLTPVQRVTAMKDLTPPEMTCQLEPEITTTWGEQWLKSDPLATKSKSDSVRFPSGYTLDFNNLTNGRALYNPADIMAPVLLIRGEWDKYPDNNDEGSLLSELKNSPGKKYVVIEKATHVMHLEKNRHQLYDETLNFLKSGAASPKANDHAFAVIFEVIPADGHKDDYLSIASGLKPELEKIKGFISIERFQSIYHPEKILSLSFWENEKAIQQWRNLETHRSAQLKGREYVFKDYRLRVAQVVRDYGMSDRKEAPSDSRSYHK